MRITVDPHPALHLVAFVTRFPDPLVAMPSPDWLTDLLSVDATAPLVPDDATRAGVRDLLRHGGYKPTGRGKPASEYLFQAAQRGHLTPINAAVDACNVVSLHAALPISVVDLERATPPFRVGIVPEGRYVFNAGGQEIRLDGLLCLSDADGPCANAVKDSQRTKTSADTRTTLSALWGRASDPARTQDAAAWYRALLGRLGAATEEVELQMA